MGVFLLFFYKKEVNFLGLGSRRTGRRFRGKENIRKANKFFDEEKPWVTYRENPDQCAHTLFTCTQIIASLGNLLNPFIPAACRKLGSL
ncbi:hypothetical protein [Paenibacillus oralis]|uniref:hypothetical protein n=1 Tax=Paenibacillus oralis TaxID=2490856 RepID=UPI001FE37E11|nr:hypothetical protein [Paenibacillus oralis]